MREGSVRLPASSVDVCVATSMAAAADVVASPSVPLPQLAPIPVPITEGNLSTCSPPVPGQDGCSAGLPSPCPTEEPHRIDAFSASVFVARDIATVGVPVPITNAISATPQVLIAGHGSEALPVTLQPQAIRMPFGLPHFAVAEPFELCSPLPSVHSNPSMEPALHSWPVGDGHSDEDGESFSSQSSGSSLTFPRPIVQVLTVPGLEPVSTVKDVHAAHLHFVGKNQDTEAEGIGVRTR